MKIYCYETRTLFTNYKDIQDFVKKPKVSDILKVLDNPNKSFCKYHWCTDLSLFDNTDLSKGKDNIKKPIYCFETKQLFESVNAAARYMNIDVSSINRCINNPKRTSCNYHWCTDLSLFDDSELVNNKSPVRQSIYCYETKEKFDSIAEAALKYNTYVSNITNVLDKADKTVSSCHWCTKLDIFDNVELYGGYDKIIQVYCYETKEKFVSITDAQNKYKVSGIARALNDPHKTAGSYHWCTKLDNFENTKLTIGSESIKIPVYCYETKEKFESITQAADYIGFTNGSSISNVLDNPKRTAGNCHWCTSLDKFNPDDLVYPDSGTSGLEKEIVDLIKSIYDKEVIENSRNIISPYELDIYLPELNLAFEFNGDYWHSEIKGKDKNYHINKTNLCKDKDIQLIHIFEYQYRENPIIIKSMIMNKLNKNRIKLYARNCEVKLIYDNNITKQFLEENHIQGYVHSNINIGLYCNNILVSLMTFGKSRFDKSIEYELLRYASLRSTNVIGGASKILKFFEINYKPNSLISYADISYSNGNLYNKLGFNFIGTSDPDYVSIKNGIVYPRYQTMKHKLHKLLGEENFDINLTEQQNLDNNGFLRIWKCGNLKYLKEYK